MLDDVDIENLSVFVISSTQLGAREKDTRNAIKLMSGSRVRHYWDGDQRVGLAIQALIHGMDDPAWDFWMLFAPGVSWPKEETPMPDWWEHNLWALGVTHPERRLDADRFARKAFELSGSAGSERSEKHGAPGEQ